MSNEARELFTINPPGGGGFGARLCRSDASHFRHEKDEDCLVRFMIWMADSELLLRWKAVNICSVSASRFFNKSIIVASYKMVDDGVLLQASGAGGLLRRKLHSLTSEQIRQRVHGIHEVANGGSCWEPGGSLYTSMKHKVELGRTPGNNTSHLKTV